MKAEKKLITPEIARQMLDKNKDNRRLRPNVRDLYFQEMQAGRWKEDTGESIKIAKSGRVLDGQHRLMALVKYNKPLFFLVVEDLDESIFDVIDTGAKRNNSDIFQVAKIKSSNTIPSIIQFFEILKQNKQNLKTAQNNRKTGQELLEIFHQSPDFWLEVAKKTMTWYGQFAKILTPQTIGGFYAHFHSIDADDAQIFMDQLCGGIEFYNPTIPLLRNKLMQDKTSRRRMGQTEKNMLIIKTWNYFRTNSKVKQVKYTAELEGNIIAI